MMMIKALIIQTAIEIQDTMILAKSIIEAGVIQVGWSVKIRESMEILWMYPHLTEGEIKIAPKGLN